MPSVGRRQQIRSPSRCMLRVFSTCVRTHAGTDGLFHTALSVCLVRLRFRPSFYRASTSSQRSTADNGGWRSDFEQTRGKARTNVLKFHSQTLQELKKLSCCCDSRSYSVRRTVYWQTIERGFGYKFANGWHARSDSTES